MSKKCHHEIVHGKCVTSYVGRFAIECIKLEAKDSSLHDAEHASTTLIHTIFLQHRKLGHTPANKVAKWLGVVTYLSGKGTSMNVLKLPEICCVRVIKRT